MFKTARMQKFRLIFSQRARDKVIARLHEAGVVQLKEISELEVARKIASEETLEISSLLAKFREMGEFLKKPSGGPVAVKELTLEQTLKLAKSSLSKLEPKVKKLKEESDRLTQENQKLLEQIDILEDFRDIKFPLKYLSSTEEIHVTVGRIAEEKVNEFFGAAREALAQRVFTSTIGTGKKRIVIIVCRAADYQKLSAVLYRYEAETLELPTTIDSPSAAITRLEKKLSKIEKQQKALENEVKKLASAKSTEVFQMIEILVIQKERIECASLLGYTDATSVIEGWVRKKQVTDLEKMLSETTGGRQVFRSIDPKAEEVEKVPIDLENPKVVEDFEYVTDMYGRARYDEIDPTPFMTFTFSLFFAIALSDVGYGVALGLFMGSGFWLAKIFSRKLRRMMMVCAIFTVFVGLMIGGCFGFGSGLWVNPMERPVPMLKLVIFVGIAHLLMASGLAGALKDIFRRDWKSLIANRVSVVLLTLGFSGLVFSALGLGLYEFGINFAFPKMELFSAFNPLEPATTLVLAFKLLFYFGLIIGVVGAVLTARGMKGKFGAPLNFIYSGVVGFIADVASYTRLMALCIAGSVIAFSINLILGMVYSGIMPKEITLISAIIAIPLLIGLAFLFIAAHSFNIFLNSIGSFIHTMRLHFAEFFGKFYESGGEKFAPFSVKRTFTKVKGGD